MMNLRLILTLLVFTLLSCKTEKQEQHSASIIETCEDIFHNLPNSFDDFIAMYGYDDKKGPAPLYHKYQNIDTAFNCQEVSIDLKVKKAVSIAVGGKWNADGVSMFQKQLRRLIVENQELSNVFITSLSEKEASFWIFFFDEPHPNNDNSTELFNDLQNSPVFSDEQKELMKKTRADILSQSIHH